MFGSRRTGKTESGSVSKVTALNGKLSRTSIFSSYSGRVGSILNADFPGGFEPRECTVCLLRQFRPICPSPPHPKHLLAACSSAISFSVYHINFGTSGLLAELDWDFSRDWFFQGEF